MPDYINKVVFGNQTLIDLTSDTLNSASQLLEGVTAHDRTGATITGTCTGVKATTVSVTPYTTSQTIVPADLGDYNSITQVSVAAIAYSTSANAYGLTATIGTVAP